MSSRHIIYSHLFTLCLAVCLSACGTQCDDVDDVDDMSTRPLPDLPGDVANPDMRMALRDMASQADMEDMLEDVFDLNPTSLDPDEDGIYPPDDNCPAHHNPTQHDRDRDGVGDACDHFNFYHDPANPITLSDVDESELLGLSDTPVSSEALGLTLPFTVSAVVDPPDRDGADLDFFSFTITHPGVLLLEVIPTHSGGQRAQFFPAAIITGYGLNNANLFRVGFAKSQSNPLQREVFLPIPGRYTIITSELANFNSNALAQGSEAWRYKVRASLAPLPAPTSQITPGQLAPLPSDGTLRVHEIDARSLDSGLRASLSKRYGADHTHSRPHLPALAIVDPDTFDTLAFSGEESLSRQEAQATLELKPGQHHDTLWLVEDYIQRDERHELDITAEVEPLDLSREIETDQAPRDVRHRPLTWLEVGATIRGAIDAPRGHHPDQDLFLFRAHQGRALRLTLTPTPGSRLSPELKLGHAYAEDGQSAFFVAHRSAVPMTFDPEVRSVSYLISDAQAGEMAMLIGHAHPRSEPGGMPEGGPSYGYEVSLEELDVVVREVSALPSEHDLALDAGGYGALSFEAEQGQLFLITFASKDRGLETRLLGAGFEVMERTFADPITFKAPRAGRYTIDITSLDGQASPLDTPERVRIAPVDVHPMEELPMAMGEGTLAGPEREQHWRVEVPANTLVELGFSAQHFSAEVQVFRESETLDLLGVTSSNELVSFPEDTTLLIKVTASLDTSMGPFDYLIGARTVSLDAPWQQLPHSTTLQMPAPPFGFVVPLDLQASTLYSIQADSSTSSEALMMRLIDASTLGTFASAAPSERLRWAPTTAHQPMLFVHDATQKRQADSTVTLSVGKPSIITIPEAELPRSATYSALTDEVIYRIALPDIGALTLHSDSAIPHRVSWLAEDDLRPLPVPHLLNTSTALSSELTHYLLAVHPITAPTMPTPITISTRYKPSSQAVLEIEPNDTPATAQPVLEFPSLYTGSLSSSLDRDDVFSMTLEQGDVLWALTSAGIDTSSYALDAELVLTDSEGAVVAFTRHGAEGFFPALLAHEITQSGTYTMTLRLPPEVRYSTGTYVLFFEREPAP